MRTVLGLSLLSLVALGRNRFDGVRKMSLPALELTANDEPPSEFRIFKRGRNDSDQGPVMFDDVAAREVMAAYTAHGVRPIVDLEHKSLLDPKTDVHYDPDARGDFDLELRNGELWAVAAKWAEDGVRRLKSKTQRFPSPAFIQLDPGDGSIPRVVRLVNVGLVAQPALDNCPPLIAASSQSARRATTVGRAPSFAMMMFDAAGGENAAAEDLPMIAEAFGLDSGASLADIVQAAAAFVKEFQDAVNGEPPPANGGDSTGGTDAGGYDAGGDVAAMRRTFAEKMVRRLGLVARASRKAKPAEQQLVHFRSIIFRATNATTTDEAVDTIQRWQSSDRSLVAERRKIAQEREAVEATDRHTLTVEIVKLGALTPAQAWAKHEETGLPKTPKTDPKTGEITELGEPSAFIRRFSLSELRGFRDDSKKPGAPTQLPAGAAPGTAPTTAPVENGTMVEVTLASGATKTVEISEREVNLLKKKLGARAKDEDAVRESLVKYATMKTRAAVKADVKPVKVG